MTVQRVPCYAVGCPARVEVTLVREVAIRFMGPIRRPAGLGALARVPVADGTTVESFLAALGYEDADRARLRVMIDGRTLARDEVLGDVEELTLFLPLGGG